MAQPTCCSRTVFFGRQPKAGLATGTTWSRYPDSDLLVAPGGLLFPNQTVGIQYMLNYHLKLDLEPDGNYDATVAAGVVDPPTWPVLLTTVGSSIFSGPAVSAAQSQLWALGFDVTQPYSGEFDAETKAALAAFQSSRSIPLTGLVDSLTWHLLVTGCNSSKTNYWGFDVGWPQGSLSQSQFSCLLNQGYSFMTQEVHLETGNIWPDAVPNIQNALAAGFTNVWAYHFFNMTEDPYDQVTLSIQTLVQIWFDIEEWPSGSATIIQQNVVFLEAAAKAVTDNGWEGGIYCGREWPSLFGNYTGLSNWPLWYNPPEPRYAHYDNVPSFIDWPGTPYGGWTFPTFKQYWDGGAAVCDTNLDQDWGPALPWST